MCDEWKDTAQFFARNEEYWRDRCKKAELLLDSNGILHEWSTDNSNQDYIMNESILAGLISTFPPMNDKHPEESLPIARGLIESIK